MTVGRMAHYKVITFISLFPTPTKKLDTASVIGSVQTDRSIWRHRFAESGVFSFLNTDAGQLLILRSTDSRNKIKILFPLGVFSYSGDVLAIRDWASERAVFSFLLRTLR